MSLTDKEIDGLVEGAASSFRRCIIAAPGCSLVEADFSAIEAVIVGWFANDPTYYRLAKLGVHAYLASHALGRPADLTWPDDKLSAYFADIKNSPDDHVQHVYLCSKKTVHGASYGLTAYGMKERMPDLFPTVASAEKFRQLFFSLAPRVHDWQLFGQSTAAKQHYLGGPRQHPFSYKHWFWNVHNYVRIDRDKALRLQAADKPIREFNNAWFEIRLGDDAKRCVAFYPQSTAAGIIRLCGLRLFAPPAAQEEAFDRTYPDSYIGDRYFSQTPLRAIIHDSFLMEVPDALLADTIDRALGEMRRPVAEMPLPWAPDENLTLDAAVKVGKNWAPASDENPDGMKKWKGAAPVSEVALDSEPAEADLDDDDLDDEGEGEE